MNNNDSISRSALLVAYDAAHKGPPGGARKLIEEAPSVGGWVCVKDRLPETAGEYIVSYHPCYWDNVDRGKTLVGIDNFRGKTTWAKHKFQRVTHWMPLPEPPKEDNDATG